MFSLGPQWLLGVPETADVVVNFFLGGNFDQLHRALAPIPDWFGPKTWPPFEIRFQILIGDEIPLTLHQPKTARIEVGECADLKIPGSGERPPKLLAPAIEDRQSIRIVHRGPKILDVV